MDRRSVPPSQMILGFWFSRITIAKRKGRTGLWELADVIMAFARVRFIIFLPAVVCMRLFSERSFLKIRETWMHVDD
jgi:hypothetical protein